ncbi:hypothetical protein E2C01_002633 [Portunus trituberculatus]|uniref:Uncharacterized protein n=1 Tax=Portunus trituberculatus TaxID=210409 RepID=A0A5B7CLR7_PORTR|nr:hypothetical protein [Portunus trituberculatus]
MVPGPQPSLSHHHHHHHHHYYYCVSHHHHHHHHHQRYQTAGQQSNKQSKDISGGPSITRPPRVFMSKFTDSCFPSLQIPSLSTLPFPSLCAVHPPTVMTPLDTLHLSLPLSFSSPPLPTPPSPPPHSLPLPLSIKGPSPSHRLFHAIPPPPIFAV